MDEKDENRKVLYPEWTITELIKLDDVCVLESTGQEFLCSEIIPYKQFEYLYFGNFDFNEILFAIQCRQNRKNYVKVLIDISEQKYAFDLYKKVTRK